jgi:hypothetical protein
MRHEHRIHPDELMNPDLISEIVLGISITGLFCVFLIMVFLALN